jgi:predicted 3-demethylubiquinone-9 3-methyltransferase (glyoxalase superfamily)
VFAAIVAVTPDVRPGPRPDEVNDEMGRPARFRSPVAGSGIGTDEPGRLVSSAVVGHFAGTRPGRRAAGNREGAAMTSVRPHLWFGNNQAVEAATFYAEHIPGSSVTKVITAPEGAGVEEGAEFIVEFTVAGTPVIGLNAGPTFNLDEAFSFYLLVDTQDEVDRYWRVLTADGGEPGPCGWCKDKFGVSWQVIPRRLEELCGDFSTEANKRAMRAMLQMGKIDIAGMERAYAGEE